MAALSWTSWGAAASSLLLAGCTGLVRGDAPPSLEGSPAMPAPAAMGGTGPLAAAATTPPAPPSPGAVSVRRLNRTEYGNTVKDLLGTSLNPAAAFPADDPGAGFDTVGAAASLSPTYVRDYEAAAHALVDDLFADPARWARVATCDVEVEGAACAERVLRDFARRAWRRPVTDAEIQRISTPLRVAAELGASPTLGLRHALTAVLLSPSFIFKLELDDAQQAGMPHRLSDHELATRLSYALWSTMPDAALFAEAEAGSLQTDAALERELGRMLLDPRSSALGRNFAGQWLHYRELAAHEVETALFPEYTPELVASMQREAEAFFMEFVRTSRPLAELLTARFSYLDERLAGHYGLPVQPAAPPATWLADTSGTSRIGLLTLGALLTATSFPTRTSPVKRGEFVLKELLCDTVPPPPPDVIGLAGDDEGGAMDGLTLRQRLEKHRDKVACRGCHSLMDPLGFGLENYDATGKYRTLDQGQPIDAQGLLVDGTRFTGAIELAATLAVDPRFTPCLTKKLMTFALGRFVDQVDDPTWIAHLAGTARDNGGDFRSLLRALVMSEAFRSRQPSAP